MSETKSKPYTSRHIASIRLRHVYITSRHIVFFVLFAGPRRDRVRHHPFTQPGRLYRGDDERPEDDAVHRLRCTEGCQV